MQCTQSNALRFIGCGDRCSNLRRLMLQIPARVVPAGSTTAYNLHCWSSSWRLTGRVNPQHAYAIADYNAPRTEKLPRISVLWMFNRARPKPVQMWVGDD